MKIDPLKHLIEEVIKANDEGRGRDVHVILVEAGFNSRQVSMLQQIIQFGRVDCFRFCAKKEYSHITMNRIFSIWGEEKDKDKRMALITLAILEQE